ncbi:hypothetical protein MKEN_00554600 [Mycena kentingensis (nom. inval.)]|nr:hypothetical protein MKEN_00554600 [Mycena kentingensis (nom. inval.)]
MPLLLDLPPELILRCLHFLALDDIAACLRVNVLLAQTISGSLDIQYRAELELAGVEENVRVLSRLSIAERLEALRAREDRWRAITPLSRRIIPFPYSYGSFFYDLTTDYWFLAGMETADGTTASKVEYVDLLLGDYAPDWKVAYGGSADSECMNFFVSLEELDLLVIVTRHNCVDDPSALSIDAHLLSFSTGEPHPHATSPKIHITRYDSAAVVDTNPAAAGSILAVTCLDMMAPADPATNKLFVFNWQTGLPLLPPRYTTTAAVVFLTPEILITPSADHNLLEIHRFSLEDPAVPTALVEFRLPTLAYRTHVDPSRMQCRASPEPVRGVFSPAKQRGNFFSAPTNRLIILSYDTISDAHADRGWDEDSRTETHVFAIPSERLLARVRAAFDAHVESVPWREWGRACTRALDSAQTARAWVIASSGQRLVAFPPCAMGTAQPETHHIRLLDFNPRQVREARRRTGITTPESETTRVIEADADEADGADIEHANFAEKLTSDIAYVEYTSSQTFSYHNVYMSDSCILGMIYAEDSDPQTVDQLEVLLFG